MRRMSIKTKICLILFSILAATALFTSVLVYQYMRSASRKQIYNMNQSVLNQISQNGSMLFSTVNATSERLAYNSDLNALMLLSPEEMQGEEFQEDDEMMEQFLTELSWTQSQFSVRFDIYVKGNNGYVCSTDYSKDYEKNLERHRQNQTGSRENEWTLIETFEEPSGMGAYHYVFQVICDVEDLITGEPVGIAVINVSEKLLFDIFSDMNIAGRTVRIVNGDGQIISSQDKREIGTIYPGWDRFGESSDDMQQIEYKNCLITRSLISETGWYVLDEIPETMLMYPLEAAKVFLIVFLCLLTVGVLTLSLILSGMLSRPILEIQEKMERVIKGDLQARTTVTGSDELGNLGRSFNIMVERIDRLITSVKKEERLKRKAEIDFLQAQINPHFIYNTLSSIRCLVSMGENKEAEEMIYQFSKLLRSTLSRTEEFTTIEQEMQLIQIYGELQKIRYPDSFELTFDIEEDVKQIKIPVLLVQPIVENAIFHGGGDFVTILISAYREENDLKIVIRDNGCGMTKEQIQTSMNQEGHMNKVGLKNVDDRIKIIYGEKYGLCIQSRKGGGTEVTLHMKLLR